MAKNDRDKDLYRMMRAAGVRKKVAAEVSDAVGRTHEPGENDKGRTSSRARFQCARRPARRPRQRRSAQAQHDRPKANASAEAYDQPSAPKRSAHEPRNLAPRRSTPPPRSRSGRSTRLHGRGGGTRMRLDAAAVTQGRGPAGIRTGRAPTMIGRAARNRAARETRHSSQAWADPRSGPARPGRAARPARGAAARSLSGRSSSPHLRGSRSGSVEISREYPRHVVGGTQSDRRPSRESGP